MCGLDLDPPDNAIVWSVDEKTGSVPSPGSIRPARLCPPVTSRPTPLRAGRPGVERSDESSRTSATAQRLLFAALNVNGGEIGGWVADSSRSDNFVLFLQDLIDQTPAALELHFLCGNLSAHKSAVVKGFVERPENSHVRLHFTPTHASWLNLVESDSFQLSIR